MRAEAAAVLEAGIADMNGMAAAAALTDGIAGVAMIETAAALGAGTADVAVMTTVGVIGVLAGISGVKIIANFAGHCGPDLESAEGAWLIKVHFQCVVG